jgi:murein DD-endopeptidase MepM/ murein hydrolase activator NlpD
LRRTPGAKAEAPHNPAFLALERQIARLQAIDSAEVSLLANTQTAFERREEILRGLIRRSRIEPDQYLRRMAAARAMGGPEIPIDQIRIAGTADADFSRGYLRAAAILDHLSEVFEAMKHIPFAMPVAGGKFDPTSGFGPRLDPFTGQSVFHPGLDFGGPMGMPVFATAAGRVVFTGNRGSYGNVVEIDHGMGFHTRYAHLSGIAVWPNSFVPKGALVGRVGSTGRSTGPHLHYEVWYDDVVRDPAAFIAAGRSTAAAGVALKGPE